ncbi:SLAC1 family transporter [Pasteurella testudinis]|uniref:SLAC1 family transporter n=1 Tax=Pasteurella testudinis TaxID=761 RepID=UPI0040584CCE
MVGAVVCKWFIAKQQAQAELHHLIQCCFISLIPITSMLMALAVLPLSTSVAAGLILLGTVAQLGFAAYRTAGLWRGTHKAEATTPIIYLPTVAANFVSATALAELGYDVWAMLFFGMGALSWITLEPAILQRLRNLTPLDEAVRPIIGIQLAPAFVAANAYLHLTHGAIDNLALMLTGYGLLQLLFLFRLLPWIFANGFNMSFWGFSFGLGSMANVGLYLSQMSGETQGLAQFGIILFWIGSISIALLLAGTVLRMAQGRFLLK